MPIRYTGTKRHMADVVNDHVNRPYHSLRLRRLRPAGARVAPLPQFAWQGLWGAVVGLVAILALAAASPLADPHAIKRRVRITRGRPIDDLPYPDSVAVLHLDFPLILLLFAVLIAGCGVFAPISYLRGVDGRRRTRFEILSAQMLSFGVRMIDAQRTFWWRQATRPRGEQRRVSLRYTLKGNSWTAVFLGPVLIVLPFVWPGPVDIPLGFCLVSGTGFLAWGFMGLGMLRALTMIHRVGRRAPTANQRSSVAKVEAEARAFLWIPAGLVGLAVLAVNVVVASSLVLAVGVAIGFATGPEMDAAVAVGAAQAWFAGHLDLLRSAGGPWLTVLVSALTAGSLALVIAAYKEIASLRAISEGAQDATSRRRVRSATAVGRRHMAGTNRRRPVDRARS